jgi:hypothetical protein
MVTCKHCGRIYLYVRKKGHTKEKCNSCSVNQRRFSLKIKCVDYKGGKCEQCGYNKSLRALSFHHIDPLKKDFQISGSHCKSWKSIQIELDKCLLLCANCHMEKHEEELKK